MRAADWSTTMLCQCRCPEAIMLPSHQTFHKARSPAFLAEREREREREATRIDRGARAEREYERETENSRERAAMTAEDKLIGRRNRNVHFVIGVGHTASLTPPGDGDDGVTVLRIE